MRPVRAGCDSDGMVDHQFADARLAALYDALHPWGERADFPFYLERAMRAPAVLDAGCGTGTLLHAVRDAGHRGRLVGLDPAGAMLDRARRRTDVEWVLGELPAPGWRREFDLITMTGHAFQVLVTDEQLRAALAAVREALTGGGRFAFETRNPAARDWRRWTPEHAVAAVGAAGEPVRMAHRVDRSPDDDDEGEGGGGDLVTFTTTYTSPAWERPETSRSTLRFLDADRLGAFLAEAGLVVAERYGDFDGRPLTGDSPEIVVVARRG